MKPVCAPIAAPGLVAALALCLALTACAAPTPDTAATQQAARLATQAAQPSPTPVLPTATPAPPTATPKPSDTPVPPTATRTPTRTPVPPTPTRSPSPTPTPPPPTPTPAVSPAEPRVTQGFEYLDEEAWDKAIVEFEEAIRLDPQFAIAYLGLGYSYAFGPGDYAKAVQALEKYLQLEPDAEHRADIESDIKLMRDQMASVGPCCPTAGSGKGLLWIENFVGEPLLVDFGTNLGTQAYEVPAKQNDVSGCLCLSTDAGHYVLVVKTFTHEGRWELDIVPGQVTHFPLRYAD